MMSNVCIQDGDVLISFQSIEQLTAIGRRGHISLELNAVHLWGIELDGSPACLERCAQWLDKEEQRRAARLVREEDRQRYVLAHGGLRAVLSRYLGIAPDLVELCRNEAGKPFVTRELRGQPPITFNLSHAQGRALIAVSQEQEVGVDLERIRPDIEVTQLSERYFAPSEHAAIMQLTQEQRTARFFRFWVAKEAVLKAQGVGLWALSQCEILLVADGVGAEVLAPVGSPLQDNWRVRFLTCDEGWEAAVAAQGMDWVAQGDLSGC
ncbi:MAG TPA: 4'-phosphopantetheinyl transferase superfamily protein [Nitrospiraceae bacterium]|nr:4'-phosphopantetheinyl transferase superfamily protein [Nitrospiraceae bacterium]